MLKPTLSFATIAIALFLSFHAHAIQATRFSAQPILNQVPIEQVFDSKPCFWFLKSRPKAEAVAKLEPTEVVRIVGEHSLIIPSGERGRRAIAYLSAQKFKTQIELAAIWEQLAITIIKTSLDDWGCSRFIGSSGEIIYVGAAGEALIITKDGSMYRTRFEFDNIYGQKWDGDYTNLIPLN